MRPASAGFTGQAILRAVQSTSVCVLASSVCMGKEGLEPSRLAAHDPKSCLSANSSTSPLRRHYSFRRKACKGDFTNYIIGLHRLCPSAWPGAFWPIPVSSPGLSGCLLRAYPGVFSGPTRVSSPGQACASAAPVLGEAQWAAPVLAAARLAAPRLAVEAVGVAGAEAAVPEALLALLLAPL